MKKVMGLVLCAMIFLAFFSSTPTTSAAEDGVTAVMKKLQPPKGIVPFKLGEMNEKNRLDMGLWPMEEVLPSPPKTLDLEFWPDYGFNFKTGECYPVINFSGFDPENYYYSMRVEARRFGGENRILGRLTALSVFPWEDPNNEKPDAFLEDWIHALIFGAVGFSEVGKFDVNLFMTSSCKPYQAGVIFNAQPFFFWLEVQKKERKAVVRYHVVPFFGRKAPDTIDVQLDNDLPQKKNLPRKGRKGNHFYQIVVSLEEYARYYEGRHLTYLTTGFEEVVEYNMNYWELGQ